LHLRYFDHEFPINPRQTPRILGLHIERLEQALPGDPALREYQSVLTALQNLPPYTERNPLRITERQREKEVARERLERLAAGSPAVARHIEGIVREANGVAGLASSFDTLHELLEHQAYRLAYWRTASDEINYRRFFDVNELVGLRMEEPAVFDASHALVKQLIADGNITGLRVDHPDGLFDPESYFARLQELAGGPFYVVAEKILSEGETLSPAWQVTGTTGYGFLNVMSGLFVDGRHVRKLRRIYTRLTGRTESFDDVAYRGRLTIMLTAMASELNVLAHALNRLSETDRGTRDFTLDSCRRVLREVAAAFPTYRTYLRPGTCSSFDRDVVATVIRKARLRNPLMEDSIFEFVHGVLLPEPGSDSPASDTVRTERLRFAMRMQQFTAPVQAKGVEDTAFYRYNVLISANEVGGHPGRPAVSLDEFHASNARRQVEWPLEMLATTTHDTKRGEDARARINAISEVPDEWRKAVSEWMRINSRSRTKIEGTWAPDRNDEYALYQALVGVWPTEALSAAVPERADPELVGRVTRYMLKAVREAKLHTSWIHEHAKYGRAVAQFVERTLAGHTAERFLAAFVPFQRRIAQAGMVNSLSQLVLKLASPGVPDFYQGSELWDLSLVDPDNRRPVDYGARRAQLEALMPLIARVEAGEPAAREIGELLHHWFDGRIKMLVTACGLRLRRTASDLLLKGEYIPLVGDGLANHVVAFARCHESDTLVAVVPRLTMTMNSNNGFLPLGQGMWRETRIRLPRERTSRRFRNVFTGESVHPVNDHLHLADILRTVPVALLRSEPVANVAAYHP
jgi:(1->4)-alpha-D-glucan 1-alpha-D-glucosylmutase